MAKNGESKTSERRVEATQKQAQALTLRANGATYEAIAKALGYSSVSGVYKAIQVALHKTIEEPAAELRAIELHRLDSYLLAISRDINQQDAQQVEKVLQALVKLSPHDMPH